MTTNMIPRGNSSIAQFIESRQNNQLYFEQTATLSKQPAIAELVATFQECKKPNWDGYDALPVEKRTFINTYVFIKSLPLGFPLPSIGVEPDGHLTLEWYRHPRWTISVSVSSEGTLYYAALLGTSDPRGSEQFLGEIPRRLLNLIEEVALVKT